MLQSLHRRGAEICDTVRLVLAKRESKSRVTQGIVTFLHRGINQQDKLICECRRLALMMMNPI